MKLHSRAWIGITILPGALENESVIGPAFRCREVGAARNKFNKDSEPDPLSARSVLRNDSVQSDSVSVGTRHSLNRTIERRTSSYAAVSDINFCLASGIPSGSNKFCIIFLSPTCLSINAVV